MAQAAAAVIPAVAGLAGSLLSSNAAGNAQDDAIKTQAQFLNRELALREAAFELGKTDILAAQDIFDILQAEAGRSTEDIAQGLFGRSSRLAQERLVASGNAFGARAPEVFGNLGLEASLSAEQIRDARLQAIGALRSGQGVSVTGLGNAFNPGIGQATGNIASLQLAQGATQASNLFNIFDTLGSLGGELAGSFGQSQLAPPKIPGGQPGGPGQGML
jgi:hypothetical protein